MDNDILSKSVECLQGENHSEEALAMLDSVISRGDGARLIEEMTLKEQAAGDTQEDAVLHTMRRLESLAAHSPIIACSLMAYLLPLASRLRMHDIWDSIFLWIDTCDAKQMTDRLEAIAESQADADMRRHYEQLVRSRRSKRYDRGLP
ncbi:MAG: hypothetical protein NTV86_04085 [Planctomycetota bacterium]|nr:hypothetical protein [Planctomycetota bacterium]